MHRLTLILLLLALSCTHKQPGQGTGKDTVFSLQSVKLSDYPAAEIQIDDQSRQVSIYLPHGSSLASSRIDIVPAPGLTTSPESGATVDLDALKAIYLSDKDGNAAKFSVSVAVLPSSSTAIVALKEMKYRVRSLPRGDRFVFRLPYGADLKHLYFEAESSDAISFSPDIRDIDLTSAADVKVLAQDGQTMRTIRLEAELYPKDVGVRGVYLPSPSHTGSFLSYEAVCNSMDLLEELNFNCLFVCAWAASKVAWDSEVLMAHSTYKTKSAGNMYSSYTGGTADALRDIIDVAHSKGIKVILWFEYGFMHGIGGVNPSDPVLAKHPEWIGVREDGKACNYNSTDFYLNGYDPEVQDFMLALMQEALSLYPDVDGIQGDDRLPAMPHNAGYDEKTMKRYLADGTRQKPSGDNDPDWVRWRLDELNAFALRMHTELKRQKPSLIVCFAPNKYPWCENVLMQDWPSWIAAGAVDLLTVQCYVTANYENDVHQTLSYVSENTAANIFNPAMILKNGENVLSADQIASQLQYNRQCGTFGESQFWFDGLKTKEARDIFAAYYSYPVPFPEL